MHIDYMVIQLPTKGYQLSM